MNKWLIDTYNLKPVDCDIDDNCVTKLKFNAFVAHISYMGLFFSRTLMIFGSTPDAVAAEEYQKHERLLIIGKACRHP